eukprot:6266939-Lingulodinium_polyedra.AAC.1
MTNARKDPTCARCIPLPVTVRWHLSSAFRIVFSVQGKAAATALTSCSASNATRPQIAAGNGLGQAKSPCGQRTANSRTPALDGTRG